MDANTLGAQMSEILTMVLIFGIGPYIFGYALALAGAAVILAHGAMRAIWRKLSPQ
jgi:hypothetical protein